MASKESPQRSSVPTNFDQNLPEVKLLDPSERLSLPFPLRFALGGFLAFLGGASIGATHGGQMAGMRFRAEHAHIFPTTTPGWYLYHKSKNYHAILGAVKHGLKGGAKISFWALSFMAVEETVDRWRGERDFVSTVIAGLSVAGGFSAWNKFPFPTTVKTTKTGLFGSLVFGLSQDLVGLARGRRFRYVDTILGRRMEKAGYHPG